MKLAEICKPEENVLSVEQNRELYVVTGLEALKEGTPLPPLRGFVRSEFNPLIYHSVMNAATSSRLAESGIPPERRAIVLGSMFCDAVTQQESWRDLHAGRKISPIMFPQSVPSAIIGCTARELQIYGPMSCMGTTGPRAASMLQQAADWLSEGEADAVIAVFCDVPSLRAADWAAASLLEGAAPGFGFGAIAAVIEPEAAAGLRGAQPVMPLSRLHELMSTDSGSELYERLAGWNSEASLCR